MTPLSGIAKCRRCGEVGHRAFRCKKGGGTGDAVCFRCNVRGHFAWQCGVGITCNRCGKSGHYARECPNSNHRICHHCGLAGHLRRDCPEFKKISICFTCGQKGHVQSECSANISNKRTAPPPLQCFRCGEMGHVSRFCKLKKPLRVQKRKQVDIKRESLFATIGASPYAGTADSSPKQNSAGEELIAVKIKKKRRQKQRKSRKADRSLDTGGSQASENRKDKKAKLKRRKKPKTRSSEASSQDQILECEKPEALLSIISGYDSDEDEERT
mmetsp:Transcript_11924/g.29362  ORF Transcript_11924/g.29362 Transcript_11924/m.29362 type:complete len:271 (-) Transcript_11924:50-862(-)